MKTCHSSKGESLLYKTGIKTMQQLYLYHKINFRISSVQQKVLNLIANLIPGYISLSQSKVENKLCSTFIVIFSRRKQGLYNGLRVPTLDDDDDDDHSISKTTGPIFMIEVSYERKFKIHSYHNILKKFPCSVARGHAK